MSAPSASDAVKAAEPSPAALVAASSSAAPEEKKDSKPEATEAKPEPTEANKPEILDDPQTDTSAAETAPTIEPDPEAAARAAYDADTLYLEEHMPERLDMSTTAYGQESVNENHAPLELDADAFSDAQEPSLLDSTYGSNASGASGNTASISSSIFHYQYENGRRYHAFREGQYVLPNDDREQERLNLQHHMWRLMQHGALYTAPLEQLSDNMRILDLGCGTGIWAIEMADEFPDAEVFGVDLSPIQPDWVPPNCRFHVDDYEDDWTYREDEKFDYIHGRALGGTCADWSKFYQRVMDNLKPGGWFEIQEYDAWVFSDDDSCDKARWTMEWVDKLDIASRKFGRTMNVARFHKQWMTEAGFEDVEEQVIRIPIGPWAKDPHKKELGRWEQINMQMSVESHTLALFTRIWGYTEEQARLLIEGVKRDFRNKDLHLITSYRFVRGRKPAA
ncbi:hypothetical protein TD95_000388 [Thielaviopsis punctulata]|uniref:Methyltransferase domain-containing protein n=1 Tax=Thielaviopsis punctulata TaxID=72032 RepID=A0A0F4Z9K5_9PEZI|nr:hypothetical protein TD95_000388 [Thielaviopsis punctulata]